MLYCSEEREIYLYILYTHSKFNTWPILRVNIIEHISITYVSVEYFSRVPVQCQLVDI